MKTKTFKSVLSSPAGVRIFVVFGICLLAGHCLSGEAGGYDLKQLEQAIRTFDDKTIEAQKGKSWDAEEYEIQGPQLQGKPAASLVIDHSGKIVIHFIRRYEGFKDEAEADSGVAEHMIVFCDDSEWNLLCEVMNKWVFSDERNPRSYKNADDIWISFRRNEIPVVMELLVTKVWHIPGNELQVGWKHEWLGVD